MTEPQVQKDVRWRKHLVLITALLAIVMVCAHAGMERPLPFSAFSFDKPYMASRNDQGMIVVDKHGDRLLFLDASGASKSEIANLFALGNVILYAFKDTLIPHRNAYGRRRLAWRALIGLGVVFALFSYNQTPTWAFVAIVAVTIPLWLASVWKRTARIWANTDYGLSYEQAQAALETELALVRNTQAPVLTSLLTFGTGTCCLILGIFFAISGVMYYLITRKRGDFA